MGLMSDVAEWCWLLYHQIQWVGYGSSGLLMNTSSHSLRTWQSILNAAVTASHLSSFLVSFLLILPKNLRYLRNLGYLGGILACDGFLPPI
jgi:hypothetical protein